MIWLKAHRFAVVVVSAFALLVIGGAIAAYAFLSRDAGPVMKEFGPGEQRNWAEKLVAGLNTRDVAQVPVLRSGGESHARQTAKNRTIESSMPEPGCRFELVSTDDRGEQGRQPVPGSSSENPSYRFDMVVDVNCPGEPTSAKTIGVIAVAEMGYWEPSYFVTD
ncbi:hypothetical protein QWI29_13500 [Mycolicibacterium neoaurum]|uniref:hypothetical protein n=1 Tax=Mycolicibacterium neoaurum TaxID=1795 RepID=UPI002672AAD6|nr:hypothetical protein [Mycolicibacterium neoaurum]MDO3401049.1 hypothetical protein [Mycolicibacterium neoaurum]